MFQKFCHWVKNRADRRPLWVSAAQVALLVHLLLLVLFRYVPQVKRVDAGNLAAISTVELNDAANAELARWVEYHDPSLMTSADSAVGYSQTVRTAPFRAEVEDLPRPPQLAHPQPGNLPELDRAGWKTPDAFPVLCDVPARAARNRAKTSAVQVFRNGVPDAELTRSLSSRVAKLEGVHQPKQATEIAALPMAGRFQLAQSSGDAELDRIALHELSLRVTPGAENDDLYFVNWQRMPEKSGAKK